MAVTPSTLIDRIQSLAPFADAGSARLACQATLKALRCGLTDDEADWLAIDLGPELAAPLVRGAPPVQLSLDGFYRYVARFAGQRRSVAQEQAQVICRALAELLSASTIVRLSRNLPQLASLFTLPEPVTPPSGPHHLRDAPPAARTLASGRPGGDRPLYDARPLAIEPASLSSARSHTHSVAASKDPHGDTKLSSARGLTQEREHTSLSTTHRPVPQR